MMRKALVIALVVVAVAMLVPLAVMAADTWWETLFDHGLTGISWNRDRAITAGLWGLLSAVCIALSGKASR